MAYTSLSIKDGANNSQTMLTNTIGGSQMPVMNIGDPTTTAYAMGVAPSSNSQYAGLVSAAANSTSGYATPYFKAALNATKQQIKSSKGNLYGGFFNNTSGAAAYVQIFLLPSASVTVGTTVADFVIPLGTAFCGNWDLFVPLGASGTGITVASTTTATGSTNAAIDALFYYI